MNISDNALLSVALPCSAFGTSLLMVGIGIAFLPIVHQVGENPTSR